MSSALIALTALIVDRICGEFRFIRHPVIRMGDYIRWYERRFYADSVWQGAGLTLSLLLLCGVIAFAFESIAVLLPEWIAVVVLGVTGSMFVAHRMLYDAVREVAMAENPKEKLAMLVSRDTADLSESDLCKGAIETYAENLSDGVVAPLFYLLLFGLTGVVLYKAVNTLDSMVGYRSARYERFGKFPARLDDLLNYIPSRITALMIVLFSRRGYRFWNNGHESPNAGQPITAMALQLGIRLGGPTSYGGVVKDKPWFGSGRSGLERNDIFRALRLQNRIDLMIAGILVVSVLTGAA